MITNQPYRVSDSTGKVHPVKRLVVHVTTFEEDFPGMARTLKELKELEALGLLTSEIKRKQKSGKGCK